MTDKVAEVDQMKGSTLEDISSMVDQINREFKNKQAQLQPLMAELKVGNSLFLYFSVGGIMSLLTQPMTFFLFSSMLRH